MFHTLEKTLNKINTPVAEIAANFSGLLLLIMTVIVLVQVAFRYVLNMPLSWTDETSRFLMIYMTYLCLPMIYLDNKNISMTFVTDMFLGSRTYEFLMIIIHAVSLILFIVWINFGWNFYEAGFVMADSLPIPMYVMYVIPPVMLTISCSFALEKLFSAIHKFINFEKIKEQKIIRSIAK